MKTAAVIIDDWKLPVFKKHLEEGKYEYTIGFGVANGTLTLTVKYDCVTDLSRIITASNSECRKIKGNGS